MFHRLCQNAVWLMACLISISGISQSSQQPEFNLVLSRNDNYGDRPYWGTITDVKQDPNGYIWLSTAFKGLQRYDGENLISYQHDPQNSNSLSKNRVPCFIIDSSYVIWAATYGGGLDKFDPEKNSFIHFRHNLTDNSSLANDTVFGILRDHLGNLWVGTYGGLDLLNEKTGKFTHYKNIPGDSTSLSYNHVWSIYEDRQGELWVGCGSPFLTIGEKPEDGGLNRFNRTTGKFTRYLHDPKNPNTISNNKVRAIFDDSKGNFWIGAAGDGLQIMDRKTGKFVHYNYNPAHPEILSRPPLVPSGILAIDGITFISEDTRGSIWIGSENGTNKYDPASKTISHFNQNCFRSFLSPDGLMWFSTDEGDLYNINLSKTTIPYYFLKQPANSFYYDENDNWLWIGSRGLIRKDLNSQLIKTWNHKPYHNSLCNDTISCLKADGKGSLWIATIDGLCKFNLRTEIFTTYKHYDKDPESISSNKLSSLFIDHNKNVWTSSGNWTIEKLNPQTGKFTHYQYNSDPNNLINDYVSCFAEDRNNTIWVGTRGLYRLDQKNRKFQRYLETSIVATICVDADGIIWIGADGGLYYYDSSKDQFLVFNNPFTGATISGIKNILEDNKKNLWISTNKAILKINNKRDQIKVYNENLGIHANTLSAVTNYKSNNDKLFFGDQDGYYAFDPSSIRDINAGPIINFTDFKIAKRENSSTTSETLKESLRQSKEINLEYDENTFSINFFGIDYKSPNEKKYLFRLENYDNAWHYAGNETRAYFFRIPPGKYLFRLKAVNGEGNWSEKTMGITIAAPFWQTWWFRSLAIINILLIFYSIYAYRVRQLKKLISLRARISRDLHDEIGATLSGISIIGKMARQNLETAKTKEVENLLDKIVLNSGEMLSKMSDIVWAINPINDSFGQIVSRLKNSTQSTSTPMGISLNFEIEKNMEQFNLDMQQRKNIYLICKEAINNSLKYSQCKTLSVRFSEDNRRFHITVQDDGNGFDKLQQIDGNGLKNMEARAKEIHAKLIIESGKDKGTLIELII